MRVFIDLLWFFREEKKKYIIGISLLIIVSLLSLLPPYIVGVIVDHIEKRSLTTSDLYLWSGVLLAVATAIYIFRFFGES